MADIPSTFHSARARLESGDALKILLDLIQQLAPLHALGRIHGSLNARSVAISAGTVTLASPESDVVDFELDEQRPPEFARFSGVQIPRDRSAARAQLESQGLQLDVRRVDVYQLGVLLCHLCGVRSLTQYHRSPKTRAQVDAQLRGVMDGALGFDERVRFTTLNELRAAIREALGEDRELLSASEAGSLESTLIDHEIHHRKTPVAPLPHADVPNQLGPYEIHERLGSGGMGEVYKAYDQQRKHTVAVKVLPRELATRPDFVRRFSAEAAAVAALANPNVVSIYMVGCEGEQHYFAMQYVPGESLGQLLAKRKRLAPEEAVRIFEHCLLGLAAAHTAGLIHRDIKPGNILLHQFTGDALLADFGLVKQLDEDSFTATGIVMGTVGYVSPEYARGEKIDARSDLFSLGVVLYQMLTGRLPFQAKHLANMIYSLALEDPPPVLDLAPHTRPEIAAIVERLLEKDPAKRFQSADEVLDQLRAWRAGDDPAQLASRSIEQPEQVEVAKPVSSPVSSTRPRVRRTFWQVGLALLVCGLIASLIVQSQNSPFSSLAADAGQSEDEVSLEGSSGQTLSLSQSPATLVEPGLQRVCPKLAAKHRAVNDLHPGGSAFDAPRGDGRSGALGFVLDADPIWREQGTTWEFDYFVGDFAHGFQVVHPWQEGQIVVDLMRPGRTRVFLGGSWYVFGWQQKGPKPELVDDTGSLAWLQLQPSQKIVRVKSHLAASGRYELRFDGELVSSGQIEEAEPLSFVMPPGQIRPSMFVGHERNMDRVLVPGEAAALIKPIDGGRNMMLDINFSPIR